MPEQADLEPVKSAGETPLEVRRDQRPGEWVGIAKVQQWLGHANISITRL